MLLVGRGGQVTQERTGLRIAPRRLRRPSSQLFELVAWVDGKAVILALGDHQPSCQRVAELGGQREPPLVVELRRVGTEKHPATSNHSVQTRVASLLPAVRSPGRSVVRHFTPQSPTLRHLIAKVAPMPHYVSKVVDF